MTLVNAPEGLCEVCWGMREDDLVESVPVATHVIPRENGTLMPICTECAEADYWDDDDVKPIRLAVKAPKAPRGKKRAATTTVVKLDGPRSFFECAGCHTVLLIENGAPLNQRVLQPCCRMYLPQAMRVSA